MQGRCRATELAHSRNQLFQNQPFHHHLAPQQDPYGIHATGQPGQVEAGGSRSGRSQYELPEGIEHLYLRQLPSANNYGATTECGVWK